VLAEVAGFDAGARRVGGFQGVLKIPLPTAQAAELGTGAAKGQVREARGTKGDDEQLGMEVPVHAVKHAGRDTGEEAERDDISRDEGAGVEDHETAEGW